MSGDQMFRPRADLWMGAYLMTLWVVPDYLLTAIRQEA